MTLTLANGKQARCEMWQPMFKQSVTDVGGSVNEFSAAGAAVGMPACRGGGNLFGFVPGSVKRLNLNSGKLTICLKLVFEVAVDEQLVKTLSVARIGYIIELNLKGGAAAARRRCVNVAKHTPCAEDNFLWALEFHDGNFLADAPEDLHSDADVRLRVAAENKWRGWLIKTVKPSGTSTVRAIEGVISGVWRRILHKAGSLKEKISESRGNGGVAVGLTGTESALISEAGESQTGRLNFPAADGAEAVHRKPMAFLVSHNASSDYVILGGV